MPKPAEKKTKSARSLNLKSKNLRVALTALVLAVGVVALLISSGVFSSDSCTRQYRNDKQVTINGKVFETESTKNRQEIEKGLSGRDCIGANQAMLFTFDQPGHYAFWMKDMKFQIDMIWISEDQKIVNAKEYADPSTYPSSFQNENAPAKYVLEVPAGTVDELGLQLGTPVNF